MSFTRLKHECGYDSWLQTDLTTCRVTCPKCGAACWFKFHPNVDGGPFTRAIEMHPIDRAKRRR